MFTDDILFPISTTFPIPKTTPFQVSNVNGGDALTDTNLAQAIQNHASYSLYENYVVCETAVDQDDPFVKERFVYAKTQAVAEQFFEVKMVQS